MKKANKLFVLTLTAFSTTALAGCDMFGPKKSDIPYSFSVGLESGASIVERGSKQKLVVYDNGENTADRSFTYKSTNESVASVNAKGEITLKTEGRVNFLVTEKKSNLKRALKKEIVVVNPASKSNGGYNLSGGTTAPELAKRAEILGKLEKYAMDTHLTGITLFDNGGYVRYSDRVNIPTAGQAYIQGYGFGVLTDGTLTGTLPGTDGGNKHATFYHGAISQDSLKINQYSATGSQVSDLAGHITASYWGTVLNSEKTDYDWYPLLAKERVKAPIVDASGAISGYKELDINSDPIPMEAPNSTDLYRKWRVYVKVNGTDGEDLKFTTASAALQANGFNNRAVTIDDYMFAYKLLLTGSNGLIRGTEMANDTSYGIKGASRYYSETENDYDTDSINAIWDTYVNSGKLGLAKGYDEENAAYYLDIELINPIDAFTAKYTLSTNLVSPLPEELFVGDKAISATKKMKDSADIYGTFNNGGHDAIMDYTICLGAYTLTKWTKGKEITFARNDNWFEYTNRNRYKIPGVFYNVIDTSTDSEKNWKQLEKGNLDSAGVPTSKIKEWKNDPHVKPTKGDATFKLNVNSCTQEQWDYLFGKKGKIAQNQQWNVKPWMSNQDFLDGLFYSIDRKSFADKRGVTPSVNYLSDAYQMRNSAGGSSYNETDAHKEAVKGYAENYGYNKDKAIDCFRNAVKQLAKKGKITLGTKEKPTTITIHIRWMYQTDIKEYGEDIKYYFESAFNNDAVCGGRVKLSVKQDAVTNWEDVYNEYMMKGRFDLGFGAISGNTYNPLNFLEVLKSDNSSGFTLNWGPDTSKVDDKNPIIYDGKKWSFDALWEVADHGGLVENGAKIDPVKSCTAGRPTKLVGTGDENHLYNGFNIEFPVTFAEFNQPGSEASYDVNRLDIYVYGKGNVTVAENTRDGETPIRYDAANKKIIATVSYAKAQEVNDAIKKAKGWYGKEYTGDEAWQMNPFLLGKINNLWEYELYYELTIGAEGTTSVNYAKITKSN